MTLTAEEIDRRAAAIRMILFDVDGVLTDGRVVVNGGWHREQDVLHPRRHRDGLGAARRDQGRIPLGTPVADDAAPGRATRASRSSITACRASSPPTSGSSRTTASPTRRSPTWATMWWTSPCWRGSVSPPAPGRLRGRGALARALGQQTRGRRRSRAGTGRADSPRAGSLGGRRRLVSERAERRRLTGAMNDYAPLLAALVALLAGLTIGKAWERYKLRDGTWIDRRRVRRVAALHPRPELPGRQPDRPGDRGTDARRQPGRERARSSHDPRQPVPRKGTGRQGDHHPPDAAPAPEAEPHRARVRAALPRARLQARWVRGPRARRVQRGAAARPGERVRAGSTSRNCTKNSISGPRRTTRGSASRTSPPSIHVRRASRSSRSSRTRSDSRRCDARTIPEAVRRFQSAIDLDARAVPAYLNLGDVRVARVERQDAADIWNTLVQVAPDRAYLAFDRLEAQAARATGRRSGSPICASG